MEKLNSVLTVWRVTGIEDAKTSKGVAQKALLESTNHAGKTASVLHYLYRGNTCNGNNFKFELGMKIVGLQSGLYDRLSYFALTYEQDVFVEKMKAKFNIQEEVEEPKIETKVVETKVAELSIDDIILSKAKQQPQSAFKGFDISKYKTDNDVMEQLNNDEVYDGCEIIVEDTRRSKQYRNKHERAKSRRFTDGEWR